MSVAGDALDDGQMAVPLYQRLLVRLLVLLTWQQRAQLLACVRLRPRTKSNNEIKPLKSRIFHGSTSTTF